MIVHQHIGMHQHAQAFRQRPQQRQKVAPIRLRPEDRLPFVAARRHMIPPPGRSTRNARAIPSILRASATMSNPICRLLRCDPNARVSFYYSKPVIMVVLF